MVSIPMLVTLLYLLRKGQHHLQIMNWASNEMVLFIPHFLEGSTSYFITDFFIVAPAHTATIYQRTMQSYTYVYCHHAQLFHGTPHFQGKSFFRRFWKRCFRSRGRSAGPSPLIAAARLSFSPSASSAVFLRRNLGRLGTAGLVVCPPDNGSPAANGVTGRRDL